MQIQRTIQTVDTSHLVIEVPASFVHRQVEILVITLDETESQPTRKRRVPPAQFAGRVKELGDVMSSVSANDWGQN
ncbi:MAG: hypothetical protein PHY54_06190 [Methylococcales bacterium]|jgi:hypothetical protein|nr:hypothetical protein [Methylococcales bacterium]